MQVCNGNRDFFAAVSGLGEVECRVQLAECR